MNKRIQPVVTEEIKNMKTENIEEICPELKILEKITKTVKSEIKNNLPPTDIAYIATIFDMPGNLYNQYIKQFPLKPDPENPDLLYDYPKYYCTDFQLGNSDTQKEVEIFLRSRQKGEKEPRNSQ